MKAIKEFPFEKSRRITPQEIRAHRQAIEEKLAKKRVLRGRPPKDIKDKYLAVSIRLHPKIVAWAKKEAKTRGTQYQTVINETLLKVNHLV